MTLDDDNLLLIFFVAQIIGAWANPAISNCDNSTPINYEEVIKEAKRILEAWRKCKGVEI